MATNVFVLGLDEANRDMLERLPEASCYRFHTLLRHDELRGVEDFPVRELLALAEERLKGAGVPVDAIVTLLDFPATEMVPILARRFGTRSPSLEAVLRCNHKYWSRIEQREVAPDCVPEFAAFDPSSDAVVDDLVMTYPFWVKPLNAYRSHLGFHVESPEELRAVLPQFRAELPRLAEPLEAVMKEAELPEAIGVLGARLCLAEGLIGGHQCTLEGFVHAGQARVYGVVDSVRDEGSPTFARYQYPSSLPERVQARMENVAVRVMEHIGYDDGCFNMEFFWDPAGDHLWLLEINPRLSQSHCELFEKVDGASNAEVLLDVSLGRQPDPPRGLGQDGCAGKFFVRTFEGGTVQRCPSPEDVARAEAVAPGVHIGVHVGEGTVLEELQDQDAYSYELATIILGASTNEELLERFARVRRLLPFDIAR